MTFILFYNINNNQKFEKEYQTKEEYSRPQIINIGEVEPGTKKIQGQNKIKAPLSKLRISTTGPHSTVIKIYKEIPNHLKTIQNNTTFINQLK